MQHRQDNLLANRNFFSWYGFRSVRIQAPHFLSAGTLFFPPPLPLHSFIFVSGSHAVSG